MLYTVAMNTKQQYEKPTRTMVLLGKVEKDIIDSFADEIGIESNSAALRQIVREWARLHEAESEGRLTISKQAA